MTEQTTLSDVTLTMIVRDELMNPAGGLHAVLSRHLPYFQNVVVLDTGSVDGTRQLLEEMAGEYSQLKVYDAEFKGYGPARNTANKYVKTEYTLMVDADEVMGSPDEFTEEVKKALDFGPKKAALNVPIKTIFPSGKSLNLGGWNPRIFQQNAARFIKNVWEEVAIGGKIQKVSKPSKYLGLKNIVYHFTPSTHAWSKKNEEWYTPLEPKTDWGILKGGTYNGEAPSQINSFPLWKTPNPTALLRYGIDVQTEIEELEKRGLRVHPGIIERLTKYSP